MCIRPPIPSSPRTHDPSEPKPFSVDVPVIKPGDPTVLVNGKPVDLPQEGGKTATSGATKEAVAAKVAEQKLSGQAQEAKVRSQFEDFKNQSPNVVVNSKSTIRQNDQRSDCEKK